MLWASACSVSEIEQIWTLADTISSILRHSINQNSPDYGLVFLAEVTGKTPEWIKKLMTRSKLGNLKAATAGGGGGVEDDDDDDDFGIELASNPLASSEVQATEALERAKALEEDLARLREGHKRTESVNTQLMKQLAAEKMKNQKLQAQTKKGVSRHARTRSRGTSRNTFGQTRVDGKKKGQAGEYCCRLAGDVKHFLRMKEVDSKLSLNPTTALAAFASTEVAGKDDEEPVKMVSNLLSTSRDRKLSLNDRPSAPSSQTGGSINGLAGLTGLNRMKAKKKDRRR